MSFRVISDRIKKKYEESNAAFFIPYLVVGLLIIVILDFFDFLYGEFSWHDILVEFHGLIFDLIVFGVLLSIYNFQNNKRNDIKKYLEELKSLKGWHEKQGQIRIKFLIKKLYELGITEFNLSNFFLPNLTDNELSFKKLKNSYFKNANIEKSAIHVSNLIDSRFDFAILNSTSFNHCKLRGASFESSFLLNTNFWYCDLSNVDFTNAIVLKPLWFENLIGANNIGVEAYKDKYILKSFIFNYPINKGDYFYAFIKKYKGQTLFRICPKNLNGTTTQVEDIILTKRK